MKERPILFSAPMIRAILAGTKTQTRRVAKLPHNNPLGVWEPFWFGGENCYDRHGQEVPGRWTLGHSRTGDIIGCPIAQAGDRLWVREAWRACRGLDNTPPRDIDPGSDIEFEATKQSYAEIGLVGKLRPSMFMPRWASRITLEVTGVKVERLQEISEADAIAEGIQQWPLGFRVALSGAPKHESRSFDTAIGAFRFLWDSINGPGAWDLNPWVWAISFKKVTP